MANWKLTIVLQGLFTKGRLKLVDISNIERKHGLKKQDRGNKNTC